MNERYDMESINNSNDDNGSGDGDGIDYHYLWPLKERDTWWRHYGALKTIKLAYPRKEFV